MSKIKRNLKGKLLEDMLDYDMALFVALCYPDANLESSCWMVDMTLWLFAVDDCYDLQRQLDCGQLEELCLMFREVMDMTNHGDHGAQSGFWIVSSFGDIVRRMRNAGCDLGSVDKLIRSASCYLCTLQVRRPPGPCMLSLDEYLVHRRVGSGVETILATIEIACHAGLSDAIRQHPIAVRIDGHFIDLIALINDVHSYPKEVNGDGWNGVLIVQAALGLSAQDAINKTTEMALNAAEDIETDLATLLAADHLTGDDLH
ncbi:hypothetical protein BGZ83_002796, partial [Gryganskiella cystojenkinii]